MAGNEPRAALVVLTDVDAGYLDEFNRWYDEEHIPERMAVSGVRAARRFVRVDIPVPPSGAAGRPQLIVPPKYLTVYDLDDAGVVRGDAWMSLGRRGSPLSERVGPHMRNTLRGGYEQLRAFTHE
jgi:hypothetical protein